jgi:hypothetical protein
LALVRSAASRYAARDNLASFCKKVPQGFNILVIDPLGFISAKPADFSLEKRAALCWFACAFSYQLSSPIKKVKSTACYVKRDTLADILVTD